MIETVFIWPQITGFLYSVEDSYIIFVENISVKIGFLILCVIRLFSYNKVFFLCQILFLNAIIEEHKEKTYQY